MSLFLFVGDSIIRPDNVLKCLISGCAAQHSTMPEV